MMIIFLEKEENGVVLTDIENNYNKEKLKEPLILKSFHSGFYCLNEKFLK